MPKQARIGTALGQCWKYQTHAGPIMDYNVMFTELLLSHPYSLSDGFPRTPLDRVSRLVDDVSSLIVAPVNRQ